MKQKLNSHNLEICHAARAQLRGGLAASVSASKIARVLQVLIFAVSCLFASKLTAQNLQNATQEIVPQAKKSQTATQEQNAKNSQNAAQSQNAQEPQDLQIAAQELDAKNLQATAKTQAAQNAAAPQEKKENEMQTCDFYPVTDFFNLMEQLYNNLNKMCLLSRETANLEATGLIVVRTWQDLKAQDIPADYPHHFYMFASGNRIRVKVLPHLLGKTNLIPSMELPKSIPSPYVVVPVISNCDEPISCGHSDYKIADYYRDLGLPFGDYKANSWYQWVKADSNSEMYKQTHSLSYLTIYIADFAGFEYIDLFPKIPVDDIANIGIQCQLCRSPVKLDNTVTP